jgi:hypothetical protein
MKMAMVEFVAVMMVCFRTGRVTPAVDISKGESVEMATERLLEQMKDSQPRITLQMNRPKDVRLRWTQR